MLRRIGLHGIILLLFLTVNGIAQIKCKIEHYSTEDGLSHDGVMNILKDRDGFMWFGTWDGINRFDGHNFVTYKTRPGDSSSLKINRVDNIIEDKHGFLWLEVYDNQVYRFDKQRKKFLAISNLLAEKKIRNILFSGIELAGKDFVWLTTLDQGVFGVKNTGADKPEIISYGIGQKDGFELPSNRVNFLKEDKQKSIWIGTEGGLSCLHFDQLGNYKNKSLDVDFAKGMAYTCMAEDSRNLWFGTSNGYLIRYDKSSGQFFKEKVADNRINALLVSKNQQVLYATAGRDVISTNISDLKNVRASMPGIGPMLSMYEDKTGLLWIEPEKHGLIKYNPVTRAFKYFFQENDANFYNIAKEYKVFEDHNGRVWMSMKGGGFGYYNRTADVIEYFYNKPGSPDHQFSNIVAYSYFDPAGVLWLSTRDRGIDKIIFQANDFKHGLLVAHTLNKSDNEIRGIFSDQYKRLWLTSKSGKLYVFDHGKEVKDIFINEPAGGIGTVYNMLQDRKGVMWLGTKGNGLFRAVPIDKTGLKYKLTHYQAKKNDVNSLSSDLIYSLLEDRKGRIWVATYQYGINLIVPDGDNIRFVNSHNSFKNYPVGSWKARHLEEDGTGKIWIATTNGLVIFDPDKGNPNDYIFKSYGKVAGDKTSLGNNDAQYIYKDSKNRMWVATSGGGLNKALELSDKGLKFKVYTKEDGLPSDYILSVVEDNAHNLWLGTENGISKLDPEQQRFRNYDSYDGLPKTGLSEGSSLKLPNGDLLFGCINGYITFNPAAITDQKIKAKMALTNLQINNKDVNPGEAGSPLRIDINDTKEIKLKYNENIISIDFSVLDYRSSNKQIYAYRLNGFDTEWHNVKNQRKATYTNLPSGNYVFEVKSLNADLYENLPIKTVSIKIAPPPWRTAWAYILYLILFGILIGVARRIVFTMIRLRNRIAVEQRLTELKLSFFTNISHELRTPLTLIVNPIEEISRLENLSPKGQEYINVVRRNANRMVRFINQLLDFRKAQSGKMDLKITRTEVVALVKDIATYFSEVAREKQIELLVLPNVKELYAWIDSEKIDIVIYNLLSNAFKFTPNNKVIRIEVNQLPGEDHFTIRVVDQGIGVSPDKLNDIFELYYEVDKAPGSNLEGTGIGLALCKEIVGFHHGEIEAQNNPDRGLTVTLMLKLGKDHFKAGENIVLDTPGSVKSVLSKPLEVISTTEPVPLEPGNKDMPLVLLVDDNNELRKFLADQLKEFYRVVEAKDGFEGLEMALKLVPDLVLSDVMMPELDGIQMLDRLKNNVITSHIPVILLTAKSSVENQIEGLKYGADYYITKPFQTDFILASIDNLLKQRRKIFESLLVSKKSVELNPGEIVITSRDETFLKEIIDIVENGMVDVEFNIDTVAESIGMGRTTFYKKFKSLTHLAPVEFVREMRLKRAKQFLDANGHNISEIAYAVGFSSAKYFSTCFKEEYGVSPSEYLKSKVLKTN
ncbi:MAG: two-component regulator propeller domain-containing protein [Candidatus Pedobacter colombiensis]|uniref:histidine kinase n=1 Tax=Candidatus Pedobacter colombiensis TaxID=3121371 RepID=A0AAJ5WAD7_9SPHI|nr:hybrid sensor histidine kinase/response regulator transcription factor [Pedobacter sp.]WEK20278.1 MAG: two-component regulator propeller domain-containing protein [Pedobacter sp.]